MKIGEIIKESWEIVKKHYWFIMGALLIPFLINLLFNGAEFLAEDFPFGYFILVLAGMFVSIVLQIGVIRILLSLSVGKIEEYSIFLEGGSYFWKYTLGALRYAVIVMFGFILLIIPGIIWGIKYSQWQYFYLDKKLSIKDSFRKSAEVTEGKKGDIFLLFLAMFGLIIVSAIPLGLGLLATIPLVTVSAVVLYRKLLPVETLPTQNPETTSQEMPAPQPPAPFVPLGQ